MKKQRKGITLIALVITIIILLILAAITINLTVGQRGVLIRSQKAGKNYQEAVKREDEELENLWAEKDDIINEINGNGGGTTPTAPDGGDDKDPITPTEPEPSEEVKALKAGDYIKYNTGVEGVGVITCRVLYPVDSEYGLQIISDKNVAYLKLGGENWEGGKKAYNEAIETLNHEAEKYVNEVYAYDGRCVGSIPIVQNGTFVNKNKVRDSPGNIRDTMATVSIPETWPVREGWTSRDTGCYDSDVNYTIDVTTLQGLGMSRSNNSYWLASRWAGTISGDRRFTVRYWDVGDYLNNGYMCRIPGIYDAPKGYTIGNGFRPCISLKASTIKIIDGNGTSEATAYTLGI